jgi:hypothetical protein
MLYKQDHFDIGGHDQRFTPFGYEDSDIFNRWILAGYEMVQSRDALCYHLTCRGHRWNKGVGIENPDYESIMTRCRRDFIRKWGDWINNDGYQYPIINPKYDIGFVIRNCNNQLLEALEPWCNRVYSDQSDQELYEYGTVEWLKTSFNIHNRVVPINIEPSNDTLVEIDGDKFTQQDFQTIQQLSAIIQDSGAIGEFELGNLKIQINDLTTYENQLIKNER